MELSPLLGMTESKVRADLRTTRRLQRQFPVVWSWVESGSLDLYRASMLPTAAEKHLTDPAAVAQLAEKMGSWLAEQWTKKLRPRSAQERHDRRYADRSVSVDATGDGMAALYLTSDVMSLRAVEHRLTLIAKAMRKAGEPRTLAQLRADLSVELLLGKLTVGAKDGELERPETSPTGEPLDTVELHEIGAWARPVVNVTVPIQTLMGVSDEPGVLSGGESLPAGLVRAIAEQPDSTWYRMLTDPARECVELSTTSYKPTGPIRPADGGRRADLLQQHVCASRDRVRARPPRACAERADEHREHGTRLQGSPQVQARAGVRAVEGPRRAVLVQDRGGVQPSGVQG